ncbi:MAG: UDP-N-acetylglucosamine--N-acetylmuramyl-(pentapeptide) pyrophosphoryl-undecaprenol N-acetylglucosamine transferase [Candidatus Moranbacteria bacterium]|nr:UDP-N-acetylglucosamine--N-acetylmuramyl-(pentapeptide) pyrophosphoryl-undecaprenol N-acetylglucosamine transferase [Candidatus Moranbacteria bacterium]
MAKRIVLCGGFSGGHIFPLVTVVQYLKKNYGENNFEFLFIGPRGDLEDNLMVENKIPQKNILCGKLRRYFSLKYFTDSLKIPVGLLQSLWHLLVFMPDMVFAKGGFASVPVVLAAKIYRIPVIIHESDAVPGIANKILGSIADAVGINFEKAKRYFPEKKVFFAGIPVKADSIGGNKDRAREFLGMKKEIKPVILFLGGSQGAFAINETVINSLKKLTSKFQIIHQTGANHFEIIKSLAQGKGYKIGHSDYYPVAFIGKELGDILALADVVVSRAGATSIAELAANRKATILVPITRSANNHQRMNAFELSREKAAVVLEEGNFNQSMLMRYLDRIAFSRDYKLTLAQNIEKFYYPKSVEILAEKIMEISGN